jgi:hypothetical protein
MSNVSNQKKEDTRDVEQVIYDLVEYQKDEDFPRLYELLLGRKLFLPIVPKSLQSTPTHLNPGYEVYDDDYSQPTVYEKIIDGESYIFAFTTDTSPQLIDKKCLRIDWFDFVEMVLTLEDISGFSLQGEKSWLAIGKDEIRYLRDNYNQSNLNENIIFKAGGIYSCKSGEGGFSIVKVLVVEDMGVHVRLHSNQFSERPTIINPKDLQVSIGHAPILKAGFLNWEPELMLEEIVTNDELDGYHFWRDRL